MYFQIFVAILFMGGYQFGVKLVDTANIKNMVLSVHWYTFLIPPAFFSGLIESLAHRKFDPAHFIFIAEALVVPVAAIYFTGKYLTPVFNRKLMDLEQGDRNSKVAVHAGSTGFWYRILSSLLVSNNEEKASFRLIWKMTGRERLFKQTFFPSIGYIFIVIVVQFLSKPYPLKELAASNKYLLPLYFLLLVAATLSQSLITGNYQQASWIFKSVPMISPANFFRGCIKAAFAKFFLPFYAAAAIIVCSVWGIRVIPDVIIILVATYLFTMLFYYFQTPGFPFTIQKGASQGVFIMIKIFIIMALAGGAGFIHNALLHWFSHANLILIPFYFLLILYVDRIMVFRVITWKKVDSVNVY